VLAVRTIGPSEVASQQANTHGANKSWRDDIDERLRKFRQGGSKASIAGEDSAVGSRGDACRRRGDGWTVARRGRVIAFVGSNLMKFGPLLGELLAEAALSDELPGELTLS